MIQRVARHGPSLQRSRVVLLPPPGIPDPPVSVSSICRTVVYGKGGNLEASKTAEASPQGSRFRMRLRKEDRNAAMSTGTSLANPILPVRPNSGRRHTRDTLHCPVRTNTSEAILNYGHHGFFRY